MADETFANLLLAGIVAMVAVVAAHSWGIF